MKQHVSAYSQAIIRFTILAIGDNIVNLMMATE